MSYFALTTQNNGSWVIYLLSSENENKAILGALNDVLAGKRINILYDDYEMVNDPDYWTIVDWTILN